MNLFSPRSRLGLLYIHSTTAQSLFPCMNMDGRCGRRTSLAPAKKTRTVVFLALGSLGDCLPLCALASALPSSHSSRSLQQLQVSHGNDHHDDDGDVPDDARCRPAEGALIEKHGCHGENKEFDALLLSTPSDCGGSTTPVGGCSTLTVPPVVVDPILDPRPRRETVRFRRIRCFVVTHPCHCDLLRDLMKNTFDVPELPEIHPVDVPVLFEDRFGQAAPASSDGRRQERGKSVGDHADGVSKELDACMAVLEKIKPEALVFNLYSAFGFHLADALRIPCTCASPGVAPSLGGVPLGRVLPRDMLESLHRLENLDRISPCDPTPGNSTVGGQITRADLELWMLALFLPRYQRWRLKRGLPAFPPLSLKSAPPVLFGVSPTVLPRPGYWPPKADVCGFWSFPRLSPLYQPPNRLVRFLKKCEEENKAAFCVGLGSMPVLGLVKNPDRIISMAVFSLRKAGKAVILLPTSGVVLQEDADNNDVSNNDDSNNDYNTSNNKNTNISNNNTSNNNTVYNKNDASHRDDRQRSCFIGTSGNSSSSSSSGIHADRLVLEQQAKTRKHCHRPREKSDKARADHGDTSNNRDASIINEGDSGTKRGGTEGDFQESSVFYSSIGRGSGDDGGDVLQESRWSSPAAALATAVYDNYASGFVSSSNDSSTSVFSSNSAMLSETPRARQPQKQTSPSPSDVAHSGALSRLSNTIRKRARVDKTERLPEEKATAKGAQQVATKVHEGGDVVMLGEDDGWNGPFSHADGRRAAPYRKEDDFVLDLQGQGFVPHSWLFPRCQGVVHHGGSGTTGASLSAGAIQVVIPLAFDQFFFADQVEHMRVGVRVTGTLPLPSSAVGRHSAAETGRDGVNISREDLDAAIKKVLSPGVQASAGRYRAFLADEESGVERACSALVSEMLL